MTDAFPLPHCQIITFCGCPCQGNGGADSDENIDFLMYSDGYKNENNQEQRLDCEA